MDEETGVVCPICDARFYVVWWRDGYSKPEYCPMCGVGLDYAKLSELQNLAHPGLRG
jgi:Zn ribbon nucleic-acid-binding protein